MRVALVTYDDTPAQGGQGVLVGEMRQALTDKGIDVATLSGRGDHAIAFARVLRRAPLDFSLHLNRHPELITALSGDVVHLSSGPGGALLTRRLETPVVITANHTYRQAYSLTSPRRALARLEARCYRNADHILAISASTAAAVRAMGIAPSRVEVLPPGVKAPDVLDESKRVPGRLLFVGRLEDEKGVLDALAVMAILAERRADVSGRIVGRGRLERRVREACASTIGVEFLGALDAAALAAEFAAAEVVVVPSRYEGLGLVALEAMAAGAVVAGYDVEGLRDAALGVATLVKAGDVGLLAGAIGGLLSETERRRDLAARGRAAVMATHSWRRYVDRLVEVYAAVCP